jgi:hypothetical protein
MQLITFLAVKYTHILICIMYGDLSQRGRIKGIEHNLQNALYPTVASGT